MQNGPPANATDGKAEKKYSDGTLPDGWTRVKRAGSSKSRISASNLDSQSNRGSDESCCYDAFCDRQAFAGVSDKYKSEEGEAYERPIIVRGQAVFCLHESDPGWFQGYLQTRAGGKPWGMLAVQEDIDECLQCADGGFRRVSLKLLQFRDGEDISFSRVEWLGGDMMKLQNDNIAFEADRIYTGKQAIPFFERYFCNLVQKLRTVDENSTILQLLPDVAIISGTMEITMGKTGNCEGTLVE